MERRKAITAAAGASLTLLAGAAGIAINSGIVGGSSHDDVGTLTPISTRVTPPTEYVTDPATTAPSVQPTTAPAVTVSSASAVLQGRGDDGEHDDGEHQYEGAGDDD